MATSISSKITSIKTSITNGFNNAKTAVTNDGLYQLHLKRAKHIMHIAASNEVDAMILGAFGCGAFANDPIVVSRAYRDAIADYKQFFHVIEFAVYCREDETEAFYLCAVQRNP